MECWLSYYNYCPLLCFGHAVEQKLEEKLPPPPHTHTHTTLHTHHTHYTHTLHRQRALKALDERLNKTEEPLSWPTLDEAGTSSSSQEEDVSEAMLASQPEVVVVNDKPSTTGTMTQQDSTASLQTAKTESV